MGFIFVWFIFFSCSWSFYSSCSPLLYCWIIFKIQKMIPLLLLSIIHYILLKTWYVWAQPTSCIEFYTLILCRHLSVQYKIVMLREIAASSMNLRVWILIHLYPYPKYQKLDHHLWFWCTSFSLPFSCCCFLNPWNRTWQHRLGYLFNT